MFGGSLTGEEEKSSSARGKGGIGLIFGEGFRRQLVAPTIAKMAMIMIQDNRRRIFTSLFVNWRDESEKVI